MGKSADFGVRGALHPVAAPCRQTILDASQSAADLVGDVQEAVHRWALADGRARDTSIAQHFVHGVHAAVAARGVGVVRELMVIDGSLSFSTMCGLVEGM